MARCPKCRCRFATLEDEADMHGCPNCGWTGRDEPEPEQDDDESDNERERSQ